MLAKDPKYASVEPTFSGEEGGSLGKAMHFCNLEYACEWKGGNETSGLGGACGWRGGCGATPGVCDPAGCELARSGGGSEPIEIGGNCASYMSVRGGVGRLKSERCYSKCVTRADEESCMRGAGSRMMDEWTDPAGNKASCDEPMMIGEDGLINGPNAAKYVPQECLGMCRWEPSEGKCLRACEARTTEADCGAPNSGCVWDTDGGMFASGPGHTGVTEYGGLPTGIPCTGSPTTALHSDDPKVRAAEAQARVYLLPEGMKGTSCFTGPVSTCVLAAVLAGKEQMAAQEECYASVELGIDSRYEKVHVPYVPVDNMADIDYKTCKSYNLPAQIFDITFEFQARNEYDADGKVLDFFPYSSPGKCVQKKAFTMSWGDVYAVGDVRTDHNCNREDGEGNELENDDGTNDNCQITKNCRADPSTEWVKGGDT